MIVYHTADLHLKAGQEKRLEVLKWLVDKAGQEKAAAFIIAGDLFDSDTDASILRTPVKKILERGTAITFYLIPGNHDAGSFHPDYDYGRNVVQLTEKPFQVREQSGVRICGIPYQPKDFAACVRDLPPGIDILIAHGTLYDRDFIRSVVDDEDAKYMPIMPSDLENVARYAALGHIHARSFDKQYRKTRAANPGSATALDVKCRTPRIFYRLDLDPERIGLSAVDILPAPYWQDEGFFVFPGREDKVLSEVRERLAGLDPKRIMPNLIVRGFLGEKGREFHARLKQILDAQASRFSELAFNDQDIKSWDQIINHPTVQKFLRRTEPLEDELKYKIYDLVLPIFSETIK
jgi:DNA repair exonuclease SbcCD nuclease subunit